MNSNRSGHLIALSMLLLPLTVAAQETTPKLELFGGYSYIRLTEQPRILLKPASPSGWNTSLKLNVTGRIGLVADFSGHYGQRGSTSFALLDPTTFSELRRVEFIPGKIRQHTFLFGPELRLFRHGRFTVNARGLIGVAHTTTLVLPLVEPIQRASGPPITEKIFPSDSVFSASFGGSVDFRITDRVSYRVVQPELLLTRSITSTTGNWNQYNFRVSTGVVFRSGGTLSHPSSEPRFSFGVIGGAGLTDAFGYDTTRFIITSNGLEPARSRSYSTLKDYIIGPTLEFGLPWRGLSVEIDALYRPMNLTMAGVRPDGSLHSISPATVVTWQFPALAKYRFGTRALKPFIEVGPSFRVAGNLNDAAPSAYGGTAGLGIEAQVGRLKIGPVIRYTHWAGDADYAGSRTKRNQAELLLGVSF